MKVVKAQVYSRKGQILTFGREGGGSNKQRFPETHQKPRMDRREKVGVLSLSLSVLAQYRYLTQSLRTRWPGVSLASKRFLGRGE